MGCRGSPVQIWPPRPSPGQSVPSAAVRSGGFLLPPLCLPPDRWGCESAALFNAYRDCPPVIGVLPVHDCPGILQHHSLHHLPDVLDAGAGQGTVADGNGVPGVPQKGRGPRDGAWPAGTSSCHASAAIRWSAPIPPGRMRQILRVPGPARSNAICRDSTVLGGPPDG